MSRPHGTAAINQQLIMSFSTAHSSLHVSALQVGLVLVFFFLVWNINVRVQIILYGLSKLTERMIHERFRILLFFYMMIRI